MAPQAELMTLPTLPSVTTILKPHSDYSQVPIGVLEKAQERGTNLHEIWAAIALNQRWLVTVPEPLSGYATSFQNWFDEYVAEVLLVEQELEDRKWGYKGTPDAVIRIKGDRGYTLLDWKSSQFSLKIWRLQTAGYWNLAEKNGYPIARTGVLQPSPDGKPAKFREHTQTLAADFNVFLSELNVWRFFNAA